MVRDVVDRAKADSRANKYCALVKSEISLRICSLASAVSVVVLGVALSLCVCLCLKKREREREERNSRKEPHISLEP